MSPQMGPTAAAEGRGVTHDSKDGARNDGLPPRRLPLGALVGYEAVAPSEMCAEIDRGICAEAFCERCRTEGPEYHPFTHPRCARRSSAAKRRLMARLQRANQ